MVSLPDMVGIFDSGVGGLSVFREIFKRLPDESYIYYSDNAHCPYGEKSQEYVTERARWITEHLIGEGAGIIVVACNTATAAAISALRKEYSDKSSAEVREKVSALSSGRQDHIMFIGMEPAVKPAAMNTRSGVIGVLATAGTLNGNKYITSRELYSNDVKIVEHVGLGFVELVENGCTSGPEAERIVTESVKPLLDAGADTIVLGCTHYPFLKDAIEMAAAKLAPERHVTIIDPAPAVARHLVEVMQQEGLLHGGEAASGCMAGELQAKAQSGTVQPDIRLESSGDPSGLQRMFSSIARRQ